MWRCYSRRLWVCLEELRRELSMCLVLYGFLGGDKTACCVGHLDRNKKSRCLVFINFLLYKFWMMDHIWDRVCICVLFWIGL